MGPRPLEFERAALTDLLSSGGLEQLDDAEIRRAVADYERRLTQAGLARQQLRGYWDANLLPFYSEHANLPEMFNLLGLFEGFEFGEAPFEIDVGAFRSRTFANLLTSHLYFLEVSKQAEQRLLESMRALRVAQEAG